MGSKKDRKRLYVDRHVQGGIILRLLTLWLASIGLAALIGLMLQYFGNPTTGFSDYLDNASYYLVVMLMAIMATLPVAVLHLLRFTHRFAGPIVRLRQVMNELASGAEVPPLRFRKHDYWQDLADQFNEVAQALADARWRASELQAQIAALEASAGHIGGTRVEDTSVAQLTSL